MLCNGRHIARAPSELPYERTLLTLSHLCYSGLGPGYPTRDGGRTLPLGRCQTLQGANIVNLISEFEIVA